MAILVFPRKKEENRMCNSRMLAEEEGQCGKNRIAVQIQTGELAGQTFFFEAGLPVVMGRDPETCDLVLKDYPRVSRTHCMVSYDAQADRFYVTDASMNGTHLLMKQKRSLKIHTLKKGKKTELLPDSILFLADENCMIRLCIQ